MGVLRRMLQRRADSDCVIFAAQGCCSEKLSIIAFRSFSKIELPLSITRSFDFCLEICEFVSASVWRLEVGGGGEEELPGFVQL